jgi:hypothetical protein
MQNIVDGGLIKRLCMYQIMRGEVVPRKDPLSERGAQLQLSQGWRLYAVGISGRLGSVRKVGEV